jgi:hypothetical protein
MRVTLQPTTWPARLRSRDGLYALLIVLSLAFALLHAGPLNGSPAALALTVLFQLYLPGWLLARALGRHSAPHPISRFAWTLAGGLGLTILLGGLFRLLWLPVPAYLLALHIIMLALVFIPPRPAPESPPWRLTRRALPLYLLVAAACLMNLYISSLSWARFVGYEDQAIFISLSDWLAYNPGEFPNGLPLRARQVGVFNGDTRMDSDGWTYSHAAWLWTSGRAAAQLGWFDLNALFVWVAPLAVFALAYELTRREQAAALSAGALTLVALMTLDNLVYSPSYTALGRFTALQTNTLRQFALTIMLPLALLVALTYLRDRRRLDALPVALTGTALALLHPIVVTLYLMAVGGTAALSWLAQPTRKHLRDLLPLAAALLLVLVVPFAQRYARYGLAPSPDSRAPDISEIEDEDVELAASSAFLIVRDAPLVGTTYIRSPASLAYHPVITLAILLGLVAVVRWRRSLAARYVFVTTALLLVISFVPGVTAAVNAFMATVGLLLTIFLLPVPIILGVSLDAALHALERALPVMRRGLPLAVSVVMMAWAGALWFEPFPIPASARDQQAAYYQTQAQRHTIPAHHRLIAALKAVLPRTSVLTVPVDVANLVIEDISGTLMTGGRRNRNIAYAGDRRFLTESTPPAPWLDEADLAFLAEFGLTHLVLEADDTRLPQLLLQPERFEPLGAAAGYVMFAVRPGIEADELDALFGRMNARYGELTAPRWQKEGFFLARPGDAAWAELAADWERRLAEQPDDRTRLGLAFSYLMLGDDAKALPLWAALHDDYPAVALYADALAFSLRESGSPEAGADVLRGQLTSSDEAARVLAARSLLTGAFVYLLDEPGLEAAIGVTEAAPDTWEQLAVFDQPDAQRRRAALMMLAGRWTTAENWLAGIPEVRRAPQDVVAAAALALAQGQVEAALAILEPATDPDWVAAKLRLHPDRWSDNLAAQSYYLLQGERARRDGRLNDAEAAYRQAIAWGADEAGKAFLEGAADNTAVPQPVSLLAMADARALYVMQPEVRYGADETGLTVIATFGSPQPRLAYPVRSWLAQVISPDGQTVYAEVEVPASFVDGAMNRAPLDLRLDLADVPPLTPALAYLQARYDAAITSAPVTADVVLNRPESAVVPPEAEDVNRRFGENITLLAYTEQRSEDGLSLTLYWQADQPLEDDYHVFVHVIGADGQIAAQRDRRPVDDRYPTQFWRTETVIADTYVFDEALAVGAYAVRAGLYRLEDAARLPVMPADARVQDDSLLLFEFEIP